MLHDRWTKKTGRAIALAISATMVLSAGEPALAASGPKAAKKQVTAAAGEPTDFSAARRRYRRGNAAAAGIALGIIGTIGAVAAEQARRDAYERQYRYYYGPGSYYYGQPYYGYAPGYYRYHPY